LSLTNNTAVRIVLGVLAAVVAASGHQAARAFPDGAPWGAADPDAAENCATCHFDGETVRNSKALAVRGLPENLSSDTLYDLVVTFENPGGVAAGFQMIAWTENQSAGTFASQAADTETAGTAIRSTTVTKKDGAVSWAVQWRTPTTIDTTVNIYVAASAANDDQSPLGDSIHFRSYEYPVR